MRERSSGSEDSEFSSRRTNADYVPVSAIVIARNESKRIGWCLSSLTWCAQVVVVVDEADVATATIARKFTDDVYLRSDKNFDANRVWALQFARYEWILPVDADEYVPELLSRRISDIIIADSADVIRLHYRVFAYGGFLEHAVTDNTKFMFKKTFGTFEGRVHNIQKIYLERNPRIQDTGLNPLLFVVHLSHPTIAYTLDKTNRFTDLIAQGLFDSGKRFTNRDFIFTLIRATFYWMIKRKAWKDGTNGMFFAILAVFSEVVALMKLWEIQTMSVKKYEEQLEKKT